MSTDIVIRELTSLLEVRKEGRITTQATEIIMWPDDKYKLADGRTIQPLSGQWLRLTTDKKAELTGFASVKFPHKGVISYYPNMLVNIEHGYAKATLEEIQRSSRTERYQDYKVSNFVICAPVRISSRSNSLIILGPDVVSWASKLKIAPIVGWKLKSGAGLLSGVSTITVEHTYRAQKVYESVVSTEGKFEFLGFSFNSVTEAYRGLYQYLVEAPLTINKRPILPKVSEETAAMVSTELRLMLEAIGKARGEVIKQSPAPKIIAAHFDIPDIPDIPSISVPSNDIPPCV